MAAIRSVGRGTQLKQGVMSLDSPALTESFLSHRRCREVYLKLSGCQHWGSGAFGQSIVKRCQIFVHKYSLGLFASNRALELFPGPFPPVITGAPSVPIRGRISNDGQFFVEGPTQQRRNVAETRKCLAWLIDRELVWMEVASRETSSEECCFERRSPRDTLVC